MLAIICRCCGQPGLVLLAQAGRFFVPADRLVQHDVSTDIFFGGMLKSAGAGSNIIPGRTLRLPMHQPSLSLLRPTPTQEAGTH
jgi:hypothetical protein